MRSLCSRITADPAIFGGEPTIRGRRLAVEHVVGISPPGNLRAWCTTACAFACGWKALARRVRDPRQLRRIHADDPACLTSAIVISALAAALTSAAPRLGFSPITTSPASRSAWNTAATSSSAAGGDCGTRRKATAETVYRLGSSSKQFTAALVMKVVERGVVGLDDHCRRPCARPSSTVLWPKPPPIERNTFQLPRRTESPAWRSNVCAQNLSAVGSEAP